MLKGQIGRGHHLNPVCHHMHSLGGDCQTTGGNFNTKLLLLLFIPKEQVGPYLPFEQQYNIPQIPTTTIYRAYSS